MNRCAQTLLIICLQIVFQNILSVLTHLLYPLFPKTNLGRCAQALLIICLRMLFQNVFSVLTHLFARRAMRWIEELLHNVREFSKKYIRPSVRPSKYPPPSPTPIRRMRRLVQDCTISGRFQKCISARRNTQLPQTPSQRMWILVQVHVNAQWKRNFLMCAAKHNQLVSRKYSNQAQFSWFLCAQLSVIDRSPPKNDSKKVTLTLRTYMYCTL